MVGVALLKIFFLWVGVASLKIFFLWVGVALLKIFFLWVGVASPCWWVTGDILLYYAGTDRVLLKKGEAEIFNLNMNYVLDS